MRPLSASRFSARKLLPYVTVVAVVTLVAFSLVNSQVQEGSRFSFGVYWTSPTNYIQGTTPPDAYLQINYTGPGQAEFSYIIVYNSSLGSVTAARGNALVAGSVPFTVFTSIPAPSTGAVIATARVFSIQPAHNDTVFTKSLVF